jgi:hypothetical protein
MLRLNPDSDSGEESELMKYNNHDGCNDCSSITNAHFKPTIYDKINVCLNITNTIMRLLMVILLIILFSYVNDKKFIDTTKDKIGTILDNMSTITGKTIPNEVKYINEVVQNQNKAINQIEDNVRKMLDKTDDEIDNIYNFTDYQMASTKKIIEMIDTELNKVDYTMNSINMLMNAFISNNDPTKINHIINRTEYIVEHVNITKFTDNFYQLVQDMNKIAGQLGQ